MIKHARLHPENQKILEWVIDALDRAQDDNAFAEVRFDIKAGRAENFFYTDQHKASLAVKR